MSECVEGLNHYELLFSDHGIGTQHNWLCRLEALPTTMESCRGFMELLSELEEAESFQELLDTVNLLGIVLSHGDADSLLQAASALS